MQIQKLARRAVLPLALVIAGIAQAPHANAEDKPLIRFNQYPGSTGALLGEVAARQGFCEKQGIRCQGVPLQSGVLALQALMAKSIEVAMIPTEIGMGAISKGADLRIIGGSYGDLAYTLMSRSDTNLPAREKGYVAIVGALKGKRIGVFARGGGAELQFNSYLADAGLNPEDVTYVAVGSPATAYPALAVGKQIDAVFNIQPMDIMCKATEKCTVLINPNVDPVPANVRAMKGATNPYFMRADFAAQKPAIVEAFLKANTDAQTWVRDPANFEAMVQLVTPLIPLTGVPQAEMVRRQWLKSLIGAYDIRLDRKAIDAIGAFALGTGLIDKPVDVTRIVYSAAP